MLTFQDQYTQAQQTTGLSDAASTTKFKRDINQGGTRFMAVLRRPYNRTERYSNIVAGQQKYQTPEDALRVTEVTANDGNQDIPLRQIPDERSWLMLNQSGVSGTPTHFFIIGNDEVGLYPTPSASVTNGLKLIFEPRHRLLTQADYTTGTIGVTNGDATVTHSAAGFTAAMVGRVLLVEDGTDGLAYKIAAYTDTSTLELENVYQGPTNAAVTNGSWRIGEVMNIPEEFLEGPVDYAMYRHYLSRGDGSKAAGFKTLFDDSIATARDMYGAQTSSQVIWAAGVAGMTHDPVTSTPQTIT